MLLAARKCMLCSAVGVGWPWSHRRQLGSQQGTKDGCVWRQRVRASCQPLLAWTTSTHVGAGHLLGGSLLRPAHVDPRLPWAKALILLGSVDNDVAPSLEASSWSLFLWVGYWWFVAAGCSGSGGCFLRFLLHLSPAKMCSSSLLIVHTAEELPSPEIGNSTWLGDSKALLLARTFTNCHLSVNKVEYCNSICDIQFFVAFDLLNMF